jgi:hypothetical protein
MQANSPTSRLSGKIALDLGKGDTIEIVKSIDHLAAALVFFGAVNAYVALLISLSRLLLKPENKE